MSNVVFEISPVEESKSFVEVKFYIEGDASKYHKRQVNAVFDEQGVYDAVATEERVTQVAAGVAHKLAVGVITLVSDEPTQEQQSEAEQPAA